MTPEFNWSPGIGDPSFGGWLTVLLYVGAALLTFRAAKLASEMGAVATEIVIWQLLTVGLVLLGINKQLDLQSAFTEIGRYLAHQQGWYEVRRIVQTAFILGMFVFALGFGAYILAITFRMPMPTRVAVFGALFIVAFVLVRAASFHRVDQLIGASFIGLRWNWILEMGGLLVIQAASVWRASPVSEMTKKTLNQK